MEAAADFQSGLRKIEDYDYDCVLLDIMLPDGNGLNLLEQLKKMRKRENVIIISAKDSLDDKVLGLELGADDYLPKPFNLAALRVGSDASAATEKWTYAWPTYVLFPIHSRYS